MTCDPSRSGRNDSTSSRWRSSSMRSSSSSIRRDNSAALRLLRVVQSQRVSSMSSSDSGPASRTNRRTAASVQPMP